MFSPAKINLFLHITTKRENGYHELEALAAFTNNLYDEIELNSKGYISVEGEFAGSLEGENIISKILPGTGFHLVKNIPVGAGLGGGSSNAATVIREVFGYNVALERLLKYGADLPVCYESKACYMSGIGEKINKIKSFPEIYAVLVNPRKVLLTKEVYQNFYGNFTNSVEYKPESFNTEELIEYLQDKHNDLYRPAVKLMPEIAELIEILEKLDGTRLARMSGSGPTCFALFSDKSKAIKGENFIKKNYPNVWCKFSSLS